MSVNLLFWGRVGGGGGAQAGHPGALFPQPPSSQFVETKWFGVPRLMLSLKNGQ